MRTGLFLALLLIFIILSWVFSSYSWPLAVMLAIPLGLTGAILGHFLTGQTLTILSLFGFWSVRYRHQRLYRADHLLSEAEKNGTKCA
ncbi:efflux RND transporter permease subunit [Aliamphritea spongicola]|nr:efflux RND transporter permease subunit [Aliamphritea spongicola]